MDILTHLRLCMHAKSLQLCPTLCDRMDCSPPGFFVHEIFQARILAGVGFHFLLQGIFPTQGSNPGLPHCGQILYQLSHQGSTQVKILPSGDSDNAQL